MFAPYHFSPSIDDEDGVDNVYDDDDDDDNNNNNNNNNNNELQ
jgi:hypothetical protein